MRLERLSWKEDAVQGGRADREGPDTVACKGADPLHGVDRSGGDDGQRRVGDNRIHERPDVAVVAVGEQIDAVEAERLHAASIVGDLLDRAAEETRMANDPSDIREELDPGAGDDFLHRLDQRAPDQVVRSDLGGGARRGERGLIRLGHDLEIGRVAVALDFGKERFELSARKAHVLAAEVAHACRRDGRIDLTRIGERLVVPREHEDELHLRASQSCQTTSIS